MKTFVITPYYDTPRHILEKCLDSVRDQLHPCRHIVVCDGSRVEYSLVAGRDIQVISSDKTHHDLGGCARAIGCMSAINQGAEAIAYLDSDNWYHPEHLNRCVAMLASGGCDFVASARYVVDLEGKTMGRCKEHDERTACDTSCMVFGRKAFGHILAWVLMDPMHYKIGDRIVWQWIKQYVPRISYNTTPTVYYRSNYRYHYEKFGLPVPENAKVLCGNARAAD